MNCTYCCTGLRACSSGKSTTGQHRNRPSRRWPSVSHRGRRRRRTVRCGTAPASSRNVSTTVLHACHTCAAVQDRARKPRRRNEFRVRVQRHHNTEHPLLPVNARRGFDVRDQLHPVGPILIVVTERNAPVCLFDGDGLGQVAGFVDVVASGLGDRRGEYLQWNRGQQRLEKR